ncbi:DUF342 domain-containing protein [Anaerosacchariphilus polymeriproducens]|uniref:DUF342 domain-containing protein n=1 Tax=Anaerosacchariphilus polymeriproducens TaxID=1812858 RepID=A0A371AS72_9FIRM|nr:FapA family protein [Anaerosacchariphilus polymeriproducens]RDU22405.1 DUF342 domain-containing protein [Anaerosacchariphilus polymeriproducens]
MEPRNGYFQLHIEEGKGTFLRVYPPKGGGEQVKVAEVMEYLTRRHYENVDQLKMSKALKTMPEGAFQMKLSEEAKYHENESVVLNMTPDKMKIYGRFYPPSNMGQQLTVKDIVDELIFNKVQVGINQEEIQKFISDRHYCKDYILAVGQEPVQGSDAQIEYFFETNLNAKPKQNEDGTVDYHSLDMINHVRQGQLLARLTKEVPSIPGSDVMGNVIKAREVKKLKLNYGKNITLSEDGMELFSDVTGHVNLIAGKVFVSDVFEVSADVDASTGDIHYNGNVLVKGNVQNGFRVEAEGDIVIEGIVEGATVIAGGNIILKRGMNGMGKGLLRSEGNIVSKFLENCTVEAGGYIETDCILQCKVTARDEINVVGKKGFVVGGNVKAGKNIAAKIMGSHMGAMTILEVGIDPKKREEYYKLKEGIKQMRKKLDIMKPSIVDFSKRLKEGEQFSADRIKHLQTLSQHYKELKEKIEIDSQRVEMFEQQLMENESVAIKVGQIIYPGVKIVIGEESFYVKDPMKTCKFVKEDGEIKSTAY